ncbi:MAG: hypothetical protein ACI4N0_07665 [Christensenellales bacterium]
MNFTVRSICLSAISEMSLTAAPSWAAVSRVSKREIASQSSSVIWSVDRPSRENITYSTLVATAMCKSACMVISSVSANWLPSATEARAET